MTKKELIHQINNETNPKLKIFFLEMYLSKYEYIMELNGGSNDNDLYWDKDGNIYNDDFSLDELCKEDIFKWYLEGFIDLVSFEEVGKNAIKELEKWKKK